MQTCQRAESKGTELTLHSHSERHSLFKLRLASMSQVLCPSHQSFNNRPPHMHLPFSKHLPLHFVDCLPDKIPNSVEKRSHPSFSLTEKFHGILTSPKFSDLWLRYPFLNFILSCPYPSTSTCSSTFALFEHLQASIIPWLSHQLVKFSEWSSSSPSS